MEYIYDELKQFVIKQVDSFETSNTNYNYLEVHYKNKSTVPKDIIRIILILKPLPEEVNINNNYRFYIYDNSYTFEYFQIDKIINPELFYLIYKNITDNFNNSSLTNKIQYQDDDLRSYPDKNYLIEIKN